MVRAMRTTTDSPGKWNRAFSPSLSMRAPPLSRPADAQAVSRTSSATAALNGAVSLVASVTLASLRREPFCVHRPPDEHAIVGNPSTALQHSFALLLQCLAMSLLCLFRFASYLRHRCMGNRADPR